MASVDPMCAICGDTRMVIRRAKGWHSKAVPCSNCGPRATIDGEEFGKYESWAAYKSGFVVPWEEANYAAPSIGWAHLTGAEREQFEAWRVAHPFETHRMLYRWIEGRRNPWTPDEEAVPF